MDDGEKRALFRNLRVRQTPILLANESEEDEVKDDGDDDDDIDDDASSGHQNSANSSHSSVTKSPPSTLCFRPRETPCAEQRHAEDACASSDADTVEPEEHTSLPDFTQSLPNNRRAPSWQTRSVAKDERYRATSPPSPSSSADTVPPPSPDALARYHCNSTGPASDSVNGKGKLLDGTMQVARPVIITVDDRGIDGWEEDLIANAALEATKVTKLAAGYPKLSTLSFKFKECKDGAPLEDMQLSSCARGGEAEGNVGVLPAAISAHLSSYQRDGVTFLYRLYERQRGGLLADAMGLGKTVQTVCFLGAAFSIWDRSAREQDAKVPEQAPRILVVAPTSVRDNWRSEFERWTPFRVRLYESAEQSSISRAFRRGAADVLITGDNPLSGGGREYFKKPCGTKSTWKWDIVIVDEVHVARNSNTRLYTALKELPKTVMFGLTGTAVQNKLKELWNVMSLVVPNTLWPAYATFKKDFVDIINGGTKKDASPYMRAKANERIRLLRELLGKHMVRRPKSVIESHLPGKTDYCVLMRMKRNGLQGYMYQRFQSSYDVKLLRDAKVPCDCGSMEMSKDCCHRFPNTRENLQSAPIWKMHHKSQGPCERCPNCICLYLQHFSRSIAAHALLLMPEDGNIDREKAEDRMRVFEYYLGEHAGKASGPLWELEQEADVSCKLNVALQLLRSFQKSGHKTIIFYESLRLGSILQRWATNKGLVYAVIDGSVKKGERQGAVDRFNSNSHYSIFFISKKAGGAGLNICGADRVLIFEPCWNPTLDLQAGDRAHRLGQKRVVQMIRLVVENTIEHYVFKTAVTKSQVSSAILDNTKEEWRVRENEIGSMHAMLNMGNVFASQEASQDDFQVIQAAELDDGTNEDQDDLVTKEGSNQRVLNVNRNQSQEDIDVFGDDEICSLDVDNADAALVSFEGENHSQQGGAYDVTSSQLETDKLLSNGGASGRLIMTSTSARKRKRQLMGINETERTSGINPGGAEGVDFDDAAWREITPLMGSDRENLKQQITESEWGCPQQPSRKILQKKRSTAEGGFEGRKIKWQARKSTEKTAPQSLRTTTKRKESAVLKGSTAEVCSTGVKTETPKEQKAGSAFARRARVRK